MIYSFEVFVQPLAWLLLLPCTKFLCEGPWACYFRAKDAGEVGPDDLSTTSAKPDSKAKAPKQSRYGDVSTDVAEASQTR